MLWRIPVTIETVIKTKISNSTTAKLKEFLIKICLSDSWTIKNFSEQGKTSSVRNYSFKVSEQNCRLFSLYNGGTRNVSHVARARWLVPVNIRGRKVICKFRQVYHLHTKTKISASKVKGVDMVFAVLDRSWQKINSFRLYIIITKLT